MECMDRTVDYLLKKYETLKLLPPIHITKKETNITTITMGLRYAKHRPTNRTTKSPLRTKRV